jgi:uncharacterized Rmd1/YagE family protein
MYGSIDGLSSSLPTTIGDGGGAGGSSLAAMTASAIAPQHPLGGSFDDSFLISSRERCSSGSDKERIGLGVLTGVGGKSSTGLRDRSYTDESVIYPAMTEEQRNLRIDMMADEFGEMYLQTKNKGTGRHRKKIASRAKGGIFRSRKSKRRIYSCCLGSEIDTGRLQEHLNAVAMDPHSPARHKWKTKLYTDTLHLYREMPLDSFPSPGTPSAFAYPTTPTSVSSSVTTHSPPHALDTMNTIDGASNIASASHASLSGTAANFDHGDGVVRREIHDLSVKFYDPHVSEVFVFEFGAVVCWGFWRGEERDLLDRIADFVTQERIAQAAVLDNEDDVAFIVTPSSPLLSPGEQTPDISISSDVLQLSDITTTEQRLAISFAMGQSCVLAVFESQIEMKIPKYNALPLTLSRFGKVSMTCAMVGQMIGELFVIKHDLNLHTDILDTPDFFWEQEKYMKEYDLAWNYLEMTSRVDVLNKRMDMIKDLLDMLQRQVEHNELMRLDWMIIWLIIIFCSLEVGALLM